MSNTIVITGATGTIGSRVVQLLGEAGATARAVVRDVAKAAPLKVAGAQIVRGTFEDPASLRAAFEGADTLVSITPANANGLEQAVASFEAARASGVRKIVRVSALKASPDGPTDNTRQHGGTEAVLRACGIPSVILRPHAFFQNLFSALPTLAREGRIYWGAGEGRMGMVDTRDVADCVVAAATHEQFDGQTLELTGPASIDYHEVARAVGRALGRDVRYVPVPPEAASQALRELGADEWTAGIVRDYCRAYSQNWGDFTTDEVRRLSGHPPRSIDHFAREVLVPALT